MTIGIRKVYLIGNYPPDRQQSMRRFAEWLLNANGPTYPEIQVIEPPRKMKPEAWCAFSGAGKWLGYVDKFVLFPRSLRGIARRNPTAVFHIVDHSNAAYLTALPPERTLITCHDVLAIRGGLGDADAFCPASRAGQLLQRWVLRHLKKARRIVFVSESTQKQFQALPGPQWEKQESFVIPNGLNASFQPLTKEQAQLAYAKGGKIPPTRFLLHVGSALPRKNREGLIRAFCVLQDEEPDLHVIFAGEALSESQKALIRESGLELRVHSHQSPSSEELEALYNLAEALVFPSFSEGFGWPIIEAQATHCPVVASDRTAVPEVAGRDAILFDPSDPASIANGIRRVLAEPKRSQVIAVGRRNLERFTPENTVHRYYELYRQMQTG